MSQKFVLAKSIARFVYGLGSSVVDAWMEEKGRDECKNACVLRAGMRRITPAQSREVVASRCRYKRKRMPLRDGYAGCSKKDDRSSKHCGQAAVEAAFSYCWRAIIVPVMI